MQIELVLVQPAYHVKVDVGDNVRQGHGRLVGEMRRADCPDFLAGPKSDQETALESLRLPRAFPGEGPRELQHRSCARRVIVRTVVDLAFLARALQGPALAAAEMIIMGADQQVLRARRIVRQRKQCHDVVVVFSDLLHASRDLHLHFREDEATFGAGVLAIQRGLQRLEIFARRAENGRCNFVIDAGGDDAGAGKAGVERERRKLSGVG